MSQYVIINGNEYECTATSSLDYLFFTFTDKTVDEVKSIFTDITSLQIAGEDKKVYGTYENLKFVSVEETFGDELTGNEDGTSTATKKVIAKMYIKSQMEVDIDNLKTTQNEQDEILAELVYGTEV